MCVVVRERERERERGKERVCQCMCLCVCMCVRACVCVCACVRARARVRTFLPHDVSGLTIFYVLILILSIFMGFFSSSILKRVFVLFVCIVSPFRAL